MDYRGVPGLARSRHCILFHYEKGDRSTFITGNCKGGAGEFSLRRRHRHSTRGSWFSFRHCVLLYSVLLFHFSIHPVFEKAKGYQRIVIRHFCLVCNEPCRVAITKHCARSSKIGFYHQGCADPDVLYRVADIANRKPVLYSKERLGPKQVLLKNRHCDAA